MEVGGVSDHVHLLVKDTGEDVIAQSMQLKPFMVPMAIFIATILGLIYQQNSSFGNAAPAGGGGPRAPPGLGG